MNGSGIHLEFLAEDLLTERGLGEHTKDSTLDDPFRMMRERRLDRREPLVSHVTGMPEIFLLLTLLTRQSDLLGVDHNDEVTAI